MAVAGVAGVGHEDFITGLNQRQAGQLQRGRGAGRDHDAVCRNVHLKAALVPGADGLAQCLQPQGVGVLRGTVIDALRSCRLNLCGGGVVRLANVQKDHGFRAIGHLLGQLLGSLGHFHHIKRFDLFGARRKLHGLDQRTALSQIKTLST